MRLFGLHPRVMSEQRHGGQGRLHLLFLGPLGLWDHVVFVIGSSLVDSTGKGWAWARSQHGGHRRRWESRDQLFFLPPSSGKAIRRANLLFGLSVLHSSSRFSPKLLNLHSTVKLNITNFVDVISQPNSLMFLLLACSISPELRHIVKSLLVMDSAEVNLCFTASAQLRRGVL